MVDISNNAGTISGYIISFANAAITAQKLMSESGDHMSIKEFRFKVNIEATSEIKNTTDVSLKFWTTSVKNSFALTNTESQTIEIECTIAPTWAIESAE